MAVLKCWVSKNICRIFFSKHLNSCGWWCRKPLTNSFWLHLQKETSLTGSCLPPSPPLQRSQLCSSVSTDVLDPPEERSYCYCRFWEYKSHLIPSCAEGLNKSKEMIMVWNRKLKLCAWEKHGGTWCLMLILLNKYREGSRRCASLSNKTVNEGSMRWETLSTYSKAEEHLFIYHLISDPCNITSVPLKQLQYIWMYVSWMFINVYFSHSASTCQVCELLRTQEGAVSRVKCLFGSVAVHFICNAHTF